jgi:hypothetical protein
MRRLINQSARLRKKEGTLGYRPPMKTDLLDAIDAARAGDWDRAHKIVQQHEDDPLACWIHAVLHRIEGDAGNSRYWYSRTTHAYGDFVDAEQELAAIRREAGGTERE